MIPFCTFPLLGDSSVSLHKHAQSISWDCIMVCGIGDRIGNLEIEAEARAAGNKVAERWVTSLSSKGLRLTDGDRMNITHAASIVEAFRQRQIG